MDSTTFIRVRERLASGMNHDAIYVMLGAAAIAAHAQSSALIERLDDGAEVIVAYGFSLFERHILSQNSPLFQMITEPDAVLNRKDKSHVIRVPIRRISEAHRLELVCWNISPNHAPSEYTIGVIEHLGMAISKQLTMLGEALSGIFDGRIHRVAEERATYVAEKAAEEPIESENSIISQFLLDTLVKRRRLLTRDNVTYHSIRSWRAPIKKWQIAALHAVKKAPPQVLIRAITEEMIDEISRVIGAGIIRTVTAVPCGHSGRLCLARQTAQEIAKILDVSHADLFEPIPVKGKSHPKTNLKRPPLRMIRNVEGPILLIDDVATSGSHITEAVTNIRRNGNVVVPIAWISSSSS